jgi:predicted esterase
MVHEHHLTVARTARYYTVGEPGPAARELWLACHGYGQLAAEFVARLAAVASVDRLVAAPEALSRFYLERARGGSHATSPVGASWMTREDRAAEIADQVTYLDSLVDTLKTRAPRVTRLVALGFSQGVATMCRWLVHSHTRVDRAVCWGGTMPDDVLAGDLRALRGVPIALVAGSRDEFMTRDRVGQAVAAMRAAGLDVSEVTFEGGHRLDDATLVRLAATESSVGDPALRA